MPNQLWQFDIKYGYIHGENRFFYLLVFIDVFSKDVVGYHIGLRCLARHLTLTFEHALRNLSSKELSRLAIRSDNGPQMTSNQFKDAINERKQFTDRKYYKTHNKTSIAVNRRNGFFCCF